MGYSITIIVTVLIEIIHARYDNLNIKQDWWETALFYQIYPRSFKDSDGDGIGDIAGITSKLQYLREIGVDATILAPIFKSPNYDYGQDVSDYYSLNNEYGTMEDLDKLIRKSNELNMKVVLDLVPNHTSNESEWFIKSAGRDEYYADWYIWESGHINERGQRQPPNNWISVYGQTAWEYSESRDQYYLHNFGVTQPELNYRNPVVVDEMKSIIKFWLEKGVSGFRMKAVNYLFETDKDVFGGRYPNEPITGTPNLEPDDYGYLKHIYTKDIKDNYDMVVQWREVFDGISVRDHVTRIMMAEAYSTSIKNAVKYYGQGVRAGAHVPINFALIEKFDTDLDARDIKYTLDRWLTYKPLKKHANWITGNHDTSRLATRIKPGLVDAFNMIVLLSPGISITYMGEEIGMTDGSISWTETKDTLACRTDDPVKYVDVSRDPERTPFQWSSSKNAGFSNTDTTWLPLADSFTRVNVASQRAAVRSHFQIYRTLGALRRRPAFRHGRYESFAFNTDVFGFKRWYRDDAYVVIMNVGKTLRIVNLTAFDLIFGQLEVEVSSVTSSRAINDNIHANYLDLAADEALVLRMQV